MRCDQCSSRPPNTCVPLLSKVNEIHAGLHDLIKTLKALECERDEPQYFANAGLTATMRATGPELTKHSEQLQGHIDEKEQLIADIEKRYEEMQQMIQSISKHCISRLLVELQTGGNIRYLMGARGCLWSTDAGWRLITGGKLGRKSSLSDQHVGGGATRNMGDGQEGKRCQPDMSDPDFSWCL